MDASGGPSLGYVLLARLLSSYGWALVAAALVYTFAGERIALVTDLARNPGACLRWATRGLRRGDAAAEAAAAHAMMRGTGDSRLGRKNWRRGLS